MNHSIAADKFGPLGIPMAEAVQTCVHCGFCLPACPTYSVLGQEMDTPRGRIILMKEVLEGAVPLEQALPHVDRCLGCLGCETACPSGVKYRDLISPFRQHAQEQRKISVADKLKRRMLLETLPHPRRFRLAALAGSLFKPLRKLMPKQVRPMLELLPDDLPAAMKLEPRYFPAGKPRARVALLAGCAQQVLAPDINKATIDVLVANGVEVLVPEAQGCCGALAWHVGAGPEARAAARRNLRAFPRDVDAILTNAAGCGSGLHEYPLMLRGEPEEADAAEFAHMVEDVSKFLDRLGLSTEIPALPRPVTVAYHDACHLSHAQGVRSAPRALLKSIPGLMLKEIPDGEICCGSAGTYNVDQPEIAAELGQRKASNILKTGAEIVALGNIGCLSQIAAQLSGKPGAPKVLHTMQVLATAMRGEL